MPHPHGAMRTIGQECLDQLLFWTLLTWSKNSFSSSTTTTGIAYQGLAGDTPEEKAGAPSSPLTNLANYRWQSHCQGLVQLPIAA